MKYLILSLLCVFLITVPSCKKKEVNVQEDIIRPVKFEKVSYFDGRKIVKLSCIVEPESAQNMSFKISGKITKLVVKAGDVLAVGDLIAELDDESQKLNVLEAEAGVRKETSQLEASQLNYDQIKSLYENDNVSLSQYQQAQTKLQSSKSGLVSAKKRLEKLELDLANTRLVAQVSGVVADVYKDVNESITVGQALATIYSGSDVLVKINLPDNIINKVSKGTQTELFFPNSTKKSYIGVISEVSISGSSSSLTYPAKVKIKDVDSSLKVSMTGSATIYLGKSAENSKKIIIPINAVTKDTVSPFVYVLDSVVNNIGLVKKVYVNLGEISNEGIVIKSGLTTNDLLIVAGISKISEGQKVKVEF